MRTGHRPSGERRKRIKYIKRTDSEADFSLVSFSVRGHHPPLPHHTNICAVCL